MGNSTGSNGGGIYCNNSNVTLTDVTVSGNSANEMGGGLLFLSCSPTLINVTVSGNTANSHGGGIYCTGSSPDISNCTITENDATGQGDGLYTTSGSWPAVSQSNICYNGTGAYNNDDSQMLDIPDNWWGDATGPYHPNYNPGGLGDSVNIYVYPLPYLTEAETIAPPIPPTGLAALEVGVDSVTVGWLNSPIGDLAGYKVYFDSDSSGFPYADMVDVGLDTTYTLSDLIAGVTYYVAVTCYDNLDNESWYSKELAVSGATPEALNLDVGGVEDVLHLANHTPTISWLYYDPQSAPEDSFQVQVGTDNDWTVAEMWDPPAFPGPEDSVVYAGDSLADAATYYTRVRVHNGAIWGAWSQVSFRMNSLAAALIAFSPADSGGVNTSTPILVISNSSDAEGDGLTYAFEVHARASLGSLVAEADSIAEGDSTTSWLVSVTLGENAQYWWRSRAHDGYEDGEWMQTASFFTNAFSEPPNAFALLTPTDGAEIVTPLPTFDWEDAADPDPLDVVSYNISDSLSDGLRYYWKVRAVDTDSLGTWSEVFWLTVNLGNTQPPVPAILLPEVGDSLDAHDLLVWTEVEDPDPYDVVTYTLEIDDDSAFSSPEVTEEGIEGAGGKDPAVYVRLDSLEDYENLAPGTVCYWRVQAVDNHGVGSGFTSGENYFISPLPPEAIDDLTAELASDDIFLWWTKPYDNEGVASYVIYCSTETASSGDSLAGTTDTTYTDLGAAGDVGTNLYYTVRAVDGAGNKSKESNKVGEFDRDLITGE